MARIASMLNLIIIGAVGLIVGVFHDRPTMGIGDRVDRVLLAIFGISWIAAGLIIGVPDEDSVEPMMHGADLWFHLCAWSGAAFLGFTAGYCLRALWNMR